jgi:hypothetical protein
MAAACYFFGQKHYPIPYPLATLFFYLGTALALYFASQYVQLAEMIWRHVFHLGLCGVFLLVVLLVEKPRFKIKK